MCKLLSLIVTLCILNVACVVQAEEVVVATGQTFVDKVFTPLKDHLAKINIQAKIDYSKPVDALKKLEAGQAQLAGASMAPEDWYSSAAKDGYAVKFKDKLIPFNISQEETLVIVNDKNPVKALSKDQIKGLFTGKILNWKEVGGADSPVIIVWPTIHSGALEIFTKKMLDGEPHAKEVAEVATIGDTVELVAGTPEGISIANNIKGKGNVRSIDTIKLVRQLTLLSNGQPSASAKKLLDYLQGEGQQHIKK